jgi:hypothetical protein
MSNENFCAIIADGKVSNIIVVEPNSSILAKNPDWIFIGENPQRVAIGWGYENGLFIAPPPPPPPAPTWIVTKVAMISRFTPEEYVGVIGATKTDVEVQAWYDLFQAANVVDLSDQRTIAGINSFVGKNLLTQARADEILSTPAKDNEKP